MAGKEEGSTDETPHDAKLPAAVKQGADAPAASEGGGRKHRLSKADIRTILALKLGPDSHPTTDYLDDLTDTFPPEWIAERKRQLEAEAEVCKRMDEQSEAFRQRVIRSVCEKGYFEVDDEYLVNRAKANQCAIEQWAKMDFGGVLFATDEEEAEMEAQRCGLVYVPDEEDAAVLALLSSDEED